MHREACWRRLCGWLGCSAPRGEHSLARHGAHHPGSSHGACQPFGARPLIAASKLQVGAGQAATRQASGAGAAPCSNLAVEEEEPLPAPDCSAAHDACRGRSVPPAAGPCLPKRHVAAIIPEPGVCICGVAGRGHGVARPHHAGVGVQLEQVRHAAQHSAGSSIASRQAGGRRLRRVASLGQWRGAIGLPGFVCACEHQRAACVDSWAGQRQRRRRRHQAPAQLARCAAAGQLHAVQRTSCGTPIPRRICWSG